MVHFFRTFIASTISNNNNIVNKRGGRAAAPGRAGAVVLRHLLPSPAPRVGQPATGGQLDWRLRRRGVVGTERRQLRPDRRLDWPQLFDVIGGGAAAAAAGKLPPTIEPDMSRRQPSRNSRQRSAQLLQRTPPPSGRRRLKPAALHRPREEQPG